MKYSTITYALAGIIQVGAASASPRATITLENPLEWLNSNILDGGILAPERSWLSAEYTKYFAKEITHETTAHASSAQTLSVPTAQTTDTGFIDGISGRGTISNMFQELVSFAQSVASDVSNRNSNVLEQVNMLGQIIRSDVASVRSVFQTNSVVNDILLPLTNFPEFFSGAHSAVAAFETQLNSEVSYHGEQISNFVSAIGGNVTVAATDVDNILNSLHSFVQKAIDIMLSSPPLTATTLINPIISLVTILFAANPIEFVTDYSAWQSKVSSRQSIIIDNFGSAYTFVSTGLPQAENDILALLSQFASFGNAVTDGKIQNILQAWRENAYYHISNAVSADVSRLVTLNNDESLRDALQSVDYYQHHSSQRFSAEAESIQYIMLPTFGHETATVTHIESLLATLAS
ncbi:hypothetical protein H4R24_003482 [Coemansia sp. RSA 988]|nr:hypothetical protein H4R24_003482 [Coemansia sp. RSA 988]